MKKFAIPVLALVMAIAFSAFKAPKQHHGQQLYWYKVDFASQTIMAGTPLSAYDFKENVPTDCQDNGDADCLRGFQNVQNTSSTIYARGDEQIETTHE